MLELGESLVQELDGLFVRLCVGHVPLQPCHALDEVVDRLLKVLHGELGLALALVPVLLLLPLVARVEQLIQAHEGGGTD